MINPRERKWLIGGEGNSGWIVIDFSTVQELEAAVKVAIFGNYNAAQGNAIEIAQAIEGLTATGLFFGDGYTLRIASHLSHHNGLPDTYKRPLNEDEKYKFKEWEDARQAELDKRGNQGLKKEPGSCLFCGVSVGTMCGCG